jgi:N-acetylneuraminic acid mutarotase
MAYYEFPLAATGVLVLVGGNSELGNRTEQWEREMFPTDVQRQGWSRSSKTPPPTRVQASLVFDSTRKKLVMFGGFTTVAVAETWEYDATNGWEKKMPATSPPARLNASMVFDATANKVILFGGYNGTALGDTWQYDGATTTWTQLSPTPAPPGRFGAAMAWDVDRARAVLFGGVRAGFLDDTWEYAAGVWTPVTTPIAPSQRFMPAMAYFGARANPARAGRIVLFGGSGPGDNEYSDTWQYTAAGWSPITSARNPPNRSGAIMDFMPFPGDRVVLVGGTGVDSRPLEDVWVLTSDPTDGDQWAEQTPNFEPPARYGAPLVYDEKHGEMLVFGGSFGAGVYTDSWGLADSGWFSMHESLGHPVRFGHSSAYDPVRDVVVAFGGLDNAGKYRQTTHEYKLEASTRSWTLKTPTTLPGVRASAALAFDGARIVLFGGANDVMAFGDTWEWDGTNWSQHIPAPGMSPATSIAPAAAYDPINKRLVLVDQKGDTWAYANHAWTLIAPESTVPPRTPPRRYNAALTFDQQRRRIVLTGGDNTTTLFTDIWELDGSTWEQVDIPAGGPLPRINAGWASNARQRATFLVGGRAAGALGGTWAFQYRSRTPEEVCDARNEDDDGDFHLDSEDPDCCARHEPPNCGF